SSDVCSSDLERRRAKRIGVDKTVAAEVIELRRNLIIDAHVKLILARARDGCGSVDVGPRHIGVRNQGRYFGAHRVPAAWRDHPLARRILAELRPSGRKRIENSDTE